MTLIKVVLVVGIPRHCWCGRFATGRGSDCAPGRGSRSSRSTALAVASILQPNITQVIADFVGVTRGTDLVFYGVSVAFVITSIGTYFRFREQDRRMVEIVRAGAIRDAILSQGMPGESDREPAIVTETASGNERG